MCEFYVQSNLEGKKIFVLQFNFYKQESENVSNMSVKNLRLLLKTN